MNQVDQKKVRGFLEAIFVMCNFKLTKKSLGHILLHSLQHFVQFSYQYASS